MTGQTETNVKTAIAATRGVRNEFSRELRVINGIRAQKHKPQLGVQDVVDFLLKSVSTETMKTTLVNLDLPVGKE